MDWCNLGNMMNLSWNDLMGNVVVLLSNLNWHGLGNVNRVWFVDDYWHCFWYIHCYRAGHFNWVRLRYSNWHVVLDWDWMRHRVWDLDDVVNRVNVDNLAVLLVWDGLVVVSGVKSSVDGTDS